MNAGGTDCRSVGAEVETVGHAGEMGALRAPVRRSFCEQGSRTGSQSSLFWRQSFRGHFVHQLFSVQFAVSVAETFWPRELFFSSTIQLKEAEASISVAHFNNRVPKLRFAPGSDIK